MEYLYFALVTRSLNRAAWMWPESENGKHISWLVMDGLLFYIIPTENVF